MAFPVPRSSHLDNNLPNMNGFRAQKWPAMGEPNEKEITVVSVMHFSLLNNCLEIFAEGRNDETATLWILSA